MISAERGASAALPSPKPPANNYFKYITTTTTTLPSLKKERRHYYFALNSSPALVARSSTFDWKEVTGLAGRPLKKELNPFGVHALNDCWDVVAERVITILNHKDAQWTSIDAVRIGYQNQQAFPILWIAVRPGLFLAKTTISMATTKRVWNFLRKSAIVCETNGKY